MNAHAKKERIILQKLHALPAEKLAQIEEFIDFVATRSNALAQSNKSDVERFPLHHIDLWPTELSMSRSDIYDDAAR